MSDPNAQNDVGHAVVDGIVKHFSVSSLEKAAPRDAGCYRRWWYRYVGGRSAEEKALHAEAKAAGDALHDEIKRHLRTGDKALSSLALRGMHFVPPHGPRDGLIVERSLHTVTNGVISSPLTAANIPVIGYVDCAHTDGINYGTEDPSDARDPAGTIELMDWKRKGKATTREGISTLLNPDQLVRTIQMSGYGLWSHKVAGFTSIRLSHGYFVEKGGASRKVTKLHVVDDCARTWEYAEGVARTVVDVAKEHVAERVPGNVRACEVYGGCPHRSYCKAYETTSLSDLFGENNTMGLIDQLNVAPVAQPSAPPAQYAGSTSPTPVIGVKIPTAADLAVEEERLRAQQATIAQQTAPVQAHAPVQPMAIHPLAAVWEAVRAKGRGMPALAGEAAQAFAAASGVELVGSGFAGGGQLGGLMLWTVDGPAGSASIMNLARELGVDVNTLLAKPAAPSILPPDAPQSIPALASQQPAPQTNTPPPVPPQPGAEPPKKRGRKPSATPGAQPNAAAVTSPGALPTAASPVAAPGVVGTSSSVVSDGASLEVYVDCIPNTPCLSLHDYVDHMCTALVDKYCFDDQGRPTLRDIRCAPQNGPLGFGRWKGAVFALVIENPPTRNAWVLDTRGSEIAETVADALRVVCSQRDGLYVRGIR